MSTGFSFPWEKAAMRGEELPDGLSLPDQMAYTALRNTYRAYYDKTISRDAAAAEKGYRVDSWNRQEARAHGKRHKSPGGPNGAGWDAEFR